ncbi:hypothetical protein RND81_05G020600 [Saponaria officinalis]|uniref:WRKY domain-containing protein n=1 Tax=Saponaria officinalis TaxID=3572 RepID=A0AAW1KQG5_SAPOF
MEQNPIINSTMKKLIDQMENGKKSTQILRNILNQWPRLKVEAHDHHDDGVDYFKALDHHCMVALTSCVTSLSLMRSFELNSEISSGKRKINHDLDDDDHAHDDDQIKHEDLYEEVTNLPTITKNKRGCYRRRKSGDGRVEEVTHLRDDGYAWRKYGQKVILNTNHPRNYYRCTHKFDKKCPATKQVQQISENPVKFKIIYHGDHICNYNNNNNVNQPTIIIDDDSSEQHSSSAIVLNFNRNNQINPLLFPTTATTIISAVKTEYNSPPPSSDQSSSSTTIVSEQSDLISTAETATQYEVEDDYYKCMWTDLDVLHDVFLYESQDFGIHFA